MILLYVILFLEAVSRVFKSKDRIKITLINESSQIHAVIVEACAITIVSPYMNIHSFTLPKATRAWWLPVEFSGVPWRCGTLMGFFPPCSGIWDTHCWCHCQAPHSHQKITLAAWGSQEGGGETEEVVSYKSSSSRDKQEKREVDGSHKDRERWPTCKEAKERQRRRRKRAGKPRGTSSGSGRGEKERKGECGAGDEVGSSGQKKQSHRKG